MFLNLLAKLRWLDTVFKNLGVYLFYSCKRHIFRFNFTPQISGCSSIFMFLLSIYVSFADT